MDAATFHSERRYAQTPFGRTAYIERGSGPVALFIHGVPLNGFHWRHVIERLSPIRRCIALDLMGLGYTEVAPGGDVSFTAQARMIAAFLNALDIAQVDLIANDSGGAVAQIFAATNPKRVRTLTLTNCDTHDNWPPPAIVPQIEAAGRGELVDAYAKFLDDPKGRNVRFSRAYADPSVLTDEVYRVYIEPLLVSPASRDNFHRYWLAFNPQQTLAIEPLLRELRMPALIVWGLDDVFFDVRWAYWLRSTIPGVTRVVEVPDAKLFFPEDRPDALVEPLKAFIAAAAP